MTWNTDKIGTRPVLRSGDDQYLITATETSDGQPDGAIWFSRAADGCWDQGGEAPSVEYAQRWCDEHANRS